MTGRAVLHVAAMPFPTYQGTQAAVHAMLEALAAAGRNTHLLTYGEGAFDIEPSFTVHRTGDWPPLKELRSGPSLRKIALDARMVAELRALRRSLQPEIVVAHHVEATAAALAARATPLVFFAHTALCPELPTYGPAAAGRVLASAGRGFDTALCRRADAVAAISPMLASLLREQSSIDVTYVPPPWPTPPPIDAHERVQARGDLGLHAEDEVLLYCGNLDAYQGLEVLLKALAVVASERKRVLLLVATDSNPAPFFAAAHAAGVADRLRLASLRGEPARRSVHAAADLAVVPRLAPGGLPVKMLDALARGVPVVAPRRAAAGLSLEGVALLCADDDADALATAVLLALKSSQTTLGLGPVSRRYVATEHSPAVFVAALDAVVDRAREAA